MRLFCDKDGVLADFEHGAERVLGMPLKEFKAQFDSPEECDEAMWPRIYEDENFFRNLPPCKGAGEFLLWLQWHPVLPRPYILTACPKSNYQSVAQQKRDMIHANFGKQYHVLPMIGGRNKPLFMHAPGDVLIDDHRPNIEAWEKAGGIGILHRSWEQTKAELTRIANALVVAS